MPIQVYKFIAMHFKVCLMLPNIELGTGPDLSNIWDTIKSDKQDSQFGSAEVEIFQFVPFEEKHHLLFLSRQLKTEEQEKQQTLSPLLRNYCDVPQKESLLPVLSSFCLFVHALFPAYTTTPRNPFVFCPLIDIGDSASNKMKC